MAAAQAQDAATQVTEQAGQAVEAIQSGWSNLSGLVVTYALSVVGALFLLIAGYIGARIVERSVYAAFRRIPGFEETLALLFSKVARYVVLIMIIVMVLGQFGIQTASIIAALGAIGLAVGLALQGTLQNIAAGIMLLALRPFKVGEFIEVGEVRGTIEEIGLFATRLRTLDGIFLLTPNSRLWDEPVRNFSRNHSRRVDVSLQITYEADLELALETLRNVAAAEELVLTKPKPSAVVTALGDRRVTVTLRAWTHPKNYIAAKAILMRVCKLAFDKAGLSAPLPDNFEGEPPERQVGEMP